MIGIFWAALGIGGSTLLGTACGFLCNRVTDDWNDIVTAFAAGVMLSAAAFGLFLPAMEWEGSIALLGIGAAGGALFMRFTGLVCGHCGGRGWIKCHPELLFVLAIILHKFPEGMAGGVALGGMDLRAARTMVIGISLQNLPEGVVMIPPLLAAGVRRSRAAAIALATGLLNAAGVLAGALWGRLAGGVLPLALAFAGGAMLDVILDRMLPQAAKQRWGTLVVQAGFVLMAGVNAFFG